MSREISDLQATNAGVTVTASRRLSRQLRHQYDEERRAAGARVWEAPAILPYDAWLTRLWRELAARDPVNTPVLLSRVQEEALWQRAIRQAEPGSEPTDELLDLPATAAMAQRAWQLMHEWELPRDAGVFAESEDCQAFLHWANAFQNELQAAGWITHSQLASALGQQAGPIYYTGFDRLTPAQRRVFQNCRAKEVEHFAPFRSPRVIRIAARDTAVELEQAAMWARQKVDKTSQPINVAIMIPRLASLSSKVERILDDVLHPSLGFRRDNASRAFHISSGIASDEVPWIATALLILGLKAGLSLAEAGRLLRSPALALTGVRGASLDAHLRRRRAETITFDSVHEVFPGLSKHARYLIENAASTQRPSQWSSLFSQLITNVEWSDRAASRAEHQAMEHWKDLLSTLASLDLVSPRITYEQALARLRHIAHDRIFTANEQDREEDAPVQIMDLREAASAHLNFDAIWIAGLHEGAWPEPLQANPFVPLALQKEAGVPNCSAEIALADARRVIIRLAASAPEVVCSYPLFAGEEELRASPLIENFPLATDISAEPDTIARRILAAPSHKVEEQPETTAPQPARSEFTGGASVLQDQAACPFRAFAVHRLGARELEAAELGVSPRERGNAVHKALEFLWHEIKSQDQLKALSADQLQILIDDAAQRALQEAVPENTGAPERFRTLELSRLTALLHEWMNSENLRKRSFTVEEKEKGRVAEIGGIVLKIRPDRIDRYDDGSLAIVDYKTAKSLKESKNLKGDYWDGERPDAPQLPLYAIDRSEEVSEVMFAKLVPGEMGLINRDGPSLKRSLPEWKVVLEKLASDFAAGYAPVDPKLGVKSCEFCKLPGFCRVGELGLLAGDDAAGTDDE